MKLIAVVLAMLAPCVGFADAVEPWFSGEWNCRIDGRPSEIIWQVSLIPEGPCPNNNCPDHLPMIGGFREQNSGWHKLIKTSATTFDIKFTYTGDNTPWYLVYDPSSGLANGHTTWNGKRYPLSCRRK